MSRQVFPQAPSPTMTSFFLIAAITADKTQKKQVTTWEHFIYNNWESHFIAFRHCATTTTNNLVSNEELPVTFSCVNTMPKPSETNTRGELFSFQWQDPHQGCLLSVSQIYRRIYTRKTFEQGKRLKARIFVVDLGLELKSEWEPSSMVIHFRSSVSDPPRYQAWQIIPLHFCPS